MTKDLAAEFCALFQSYEFAHGSYSLGEANAAGKVEGRALTVSGEITPEHWRRHLDGDGPGVGAIPLLSDKMCAWGALDIDDRDINHKALARKIAGFGLPLCVFGSKSGGAHCYLFLTEPAPAIIVKTKLEEFAEALGYRGCEVFPKQVTRASDQDYGNWINMPLYGSKTRLCWAVVDGEDKIFGPELALEYCLGKRVEPRLLSEGFSVKIDKDKWDIELEGAPDCLIQMIREGAPFQDGNRNNILTSVFVFLRKKYGNIWRTQTNRWNAMLFVNPLEDTEVSNIADSVEKGYDYMRDKPPLNMFCKGAKCPCHKAKYGPGLTMTNDKFPRVVNCTLYLGDENLYILEYECGTRLQFTGPELTNQNIYATKLMGPICWPNRLNQARWGQFLQDIRERAIVYLPPEEATVLGQFRYLLNRFLTGHAQAKSPNHVKTQHTPYEHKGKMYLTSKALENFFTQQGVKTIPVNIMSHYFRECGGNTAAKLLLEDKKSQIRCWSIDKPVEELEPSDPETFKDFGGPF